jgi:4-oxalocrotonate tautomerase
VTLGRRVRLETDHDAREGEADMPMIEVKLYDRRVTEESVPKMIEALTQALADTSGADPSHIQVVIQGVDPRHWGIAGKQQS